MGRHRALLIGASDYEMHGVSPLPFIPGDLARLGSALEDRGFDEVQVLAAREGGKQISANYVNARVIGFLRRARPGDTLLVLLSGHGVHAGGRDYLVPEDIDEDTHPFESGCVPIDWRQHLDETPAAHVVFLIDACREGIDQESMGVAGVRQWSRQKISAALRRKVAYVYACSPAQLALFVRTHESPVDAVPGVGPGESFSIFSRSLSDVLSARPSTAPLALDEFKDAVQDRMTELHRAYRKRGEPQTLRIVTDIPSDGFFFLPVSKTPATRLSRPSAGTNTRAATYDSAAMSVGAGVSAPTRKFGIRRARRPLSVLGLLGLLGATAWAVASLNGNDKNDGEKPSKTRTDVSATAGPSGSGSKSPSAGTEESHSEAPTLFSLPNCTASDVDFTVRSTHNVYEPGEDPQLKLTATNPSSRNCKLDLGPAETVITVTQAGDEAALWSSADCPDGSGSLLVLVPAEGRATRTVEWNRKPSAPECGIPSTSSAPAGTYLVEARAPGLTKAQTSFVLEQG
ncbi:caspase domain-containing protein [Streptomyces sp. NPDC051243]|uniref:caspase domain-containing protein n=1 Tax=Streptomyces sp. NPDC051243 TaxID=3365646 RepID=UPI003792D5D0